MASVTRAVGQLLQEDIIGELCAWLERGPEVEVDADVGVVTVLVVGRVLDRQDVDWHHQAVDGHQQRLIALVHLFDT